MKARHIAAKAKAPLVPGTPDPVKSAIEVIDFADQHSSTLAMSPGRMNPYKIGMELCMAPGFFELLAWLRAQDKKVFVDLKFFDVPATVAAAVKQLRNIHASLDLGAEPGAGPVLLVDDRVDSRWTLTWAGHLLQQAGVTALLAAGMGPRPLAGFADAAHLSRTSRRMFGIPPSVLHFDGPLKSGAEPQPRSAPTFK